MTCLVWEIDWLNWQTSGPNSKKPTSMQQPWCMFRPLVDQEEGGRCTVNGLRLALMWIALCLKGRLIKSGQANFVEIESAGFCASEKINECTPQFLATRSRRYHQKFSISLHLNFELYPWSNPRSSWRRQYFNSSFRNVNDPVECYHYMIPRENLNAKI